MRCVVLFIVFNIVITDGVSQSKLRKLPSNINMPGRNTIAPFISFDGNHLLFLNDYTDDNTLTMMYSNRAAGTWKNPVELPRAINNRLNYVYGYALNADGTRIFLTNGKSGGVGRFDIYYADKRGSGWSEPQNFGAPLNSADNDGCPSLSPDGNYIYFMRCGQMSSTSASACKLFMAKSKIGNNWEEPVELPNYINTGNSQCPRIMADGETLIFSSDQMPGAKGMDLYLTRKTGNTWSQPVSLVFANTTEDDIHISAAATGRYLLKSLIQDKKAEICELLFPEETRPAWVMRVNGKVISTSSDIHINVFDTADKKRLVNIRPNEDGNFQLYLKENTIYDLSVESRNESLSYFSKRYDLMDMDGPKIDQVEVNIDAIYPGDTISLHSIQFRPYPHVMDEASDLEIRRLSRLILSNKNYNFSIVAHNYNFNEDIAITNPDLTEIEIDTVFHTKNIFVDSLNREMSYDSMAIEYKYHNDRSVKQARSVVNALLQYGVDESNITFAGNREEYDEVLSKVSPVIRLRVLKKITD
jgi:hypothetical protein